VQHARLADGRTVGQSVLDELAVRNAGADPFGSFGAVVGATIGESVAELSGVNGPFLVPGIGAQGGTAADVRRIFGSRLSAVLPSVSREVLRAGPSVAALREAAQRAIDDYTFLRS
jgi:orotidine-5'-phosphate decarboxylase